MAPDPAKIDLLLNNGATLVMELHEERPGTLCILPEEEAMEYGESPYQLREGESYEYQLPEGYSLEESALVKPSKLSPHQGRIHTNTAVGLFETDLFYGKEVVGKLRLEICSVKTGYRTDYRKMLEEITGKCVDLLLRQSSPTSQYFTAGSNPCPETSYLRFLFIHSMVSSESFSEALYRITSHPAKRWEAVEKQKEVNKIRKVNRSTLRQLQSSIHRMPLPKSHILHNRFGSLPSAVTIADKRETTDIPENRFIKHVLEIFLQVSLSVYQNPEAGKRVRDEALTCSELLSHQLDLPFFQTLSDADEIPFHSMILQRKEGYREILQAYLTADMAASLVWEGGEEVYKGGKRDVALLYEYWIFFKLTDLLEEVFGIQPTPIEELITPTKRGLELTLKKGKLKVINGVFTTNDRSLHIEFSYNRIFSGNQAYPAEGSWTRKMQPDYTLSIWPEELTKREAEEKERIAHLHFDAKYRTENYRQLFKEEEVSKNYTRSDLLKMHAYKDAIRRTAGAYILYPGTEKETFRSFHELLPGLGAFAISPASQDYTELKQFLFDVAEHFLNRSSQREYYAQQTFETFKEPPAPVYKRVKD